MIEYRQLGKSNKYFLVEYGIANENKTHKKVSHFLPSPRPIVALRLGTE